MAVKKTPAMDIGPSIVQLAGIKARVKELTARKDQLTTTVKDYIRKHGDADENGNLRFDVSDLRGVKHAWVQRRKTSTLNVERAEELLKKRKLWRSVTKVETIVTIDEDKLAALVFADKLTKAEWKSLFDESETFALYVD